MISQPNSYSSMLWRIFTSTMCVGIACSFLLSYFSDAFDLFIKKSGKVYDFNGVELPLLAVMIPAAFALISRIITLHNLISTLFRIRARFDVNHILIPMAIKVGLDNNYKLRVDCKAKRHELMRKVFYRYVSLADDSVINKHYVYEALDKWGWFWCFVEAAVVFSIFLVISFLLACYSAMLMFFVGLLVSCVSAAFFMWPTCKKAAENEWMEILDDDSRAQAVRKEFNAL